MLFLQLIVSAVNVNATKKPCGIYIFVTSEFAANDPGLRFI